jgi:hypothetical protein
MFCITMIVTLVILVLRDDALMFATALVIIGQFVATLHDSMVGRGALPADRAAFRPDSAASSSAGPLPARASRGRHGACRWTRFCISYGSPFKEGDRFCMACGKPDEVMATRRCAPDRLTDRRRQSRAGVPGHEGSDGVATDTGWTFAPHA